MQVVELPLASLKEAPWNPNSLDEEMHGRLRRSIERFDLVTPLVVRKLAPEIYETIGGAQRLSVLVEMGVPLSCST